MYDAPKSYIVPLRLFPDTKTTIVATAATSALRFTPLSSYPRSQFHHVPLASAPLSRAVGARTSQIVNRKS